MEDEYYQTIAQSLFNNEGIVELRTFKQRLTVDPDIFNKQYEGSTDGRAYAGEPIPFMVDSAFEQDYIVMVDKGTVGDRKVFLTIINMDAKQFNSSAYQYITKQEIELFEGENHFNIHNDPL